VEHLYARLVREYAKTLAAVAASEDRIRAAVRLLWKIFSTPAYHASLELIVAARTNPALKEARRPVLMQHAENLDRAALELFPATESRSDLKTNVDMILSTMQGAAASNIVWHDPDWDEAMLSYLERTARITLTTEATQPTASSSQRRARPAARGPGRAARNSRGSS
jgi:hypothetical protein